MDYEQKLEEFYSSEYAQKTVGELIQEMETGTTGIALPSMVQARAILDLKNKVDARELCRPKNVPKGSGKTVNTQVITRPDYDDWTEGSALTAADPTLADKSVTIAPFGKVTQITDLLANTSAIDFVEQIGSVHGACVRQGILDKVIGAMKGAGSPETIEKGSAADGTESDFTFGDVATAVSKLSDGGWQPDFIITSAGKMWTAFTTDYNVTQFSGALADMLKAGHVPRALGLEWYSDPYAENALTDGNGFAGYDGEVYAIVGQKGVSGIWAAMQQSPVVEIYRKGTELSNYVVTHIDGGASEGPDGSICLIKHA